MSYIDDIETFKTKIMEIKLQNPNLIGRIIILITYDLFINFRFIKNGVDSGRCFLFLKDNTNKHFNFKYTDTEVGIELQFTKQVFNKIFENIENINWDRRNNEQIVQCNNDALNMEDSCAALIDKLCGFPEGNNCNRITDIPPAYHEIVFPDIENEHDMSITINDEKLAFGSTPITILGFSFISDINCYGVLVENSNTYALPINFIFPKSRVKLNVDNSGNINDHWNIPSLPEDKPIIYGRNCSDDGLSLNIANKKIRTTRISKQHGIIRKSGEFLEITTYIKSNPLVALINFEITICATHDNMKLVLVKLNEKRNEIEKKYNIEVELNTTAK